MGASDVNLATPIGLPPGSGDPAAHFKNLGSRLTGTVASGNIVKAWVANEADYSGLFSMSKGFLTYAPVGAAAPFGGTVSSATLFLKPWLWDYLELRKSAAPGSTLPRLVSYGNVAPADVGAAIDAELGGNPRFSGLSASDRTQARTDFLAGTLRLLVSAGTMIGRPEPDPAPPSGTPTGALRLDLSFLDQTGATLDPAFYFDLWGLVGGRLVSGHPLLEIATRPVTPGLAPLEGRTRLKVTGSGMVQGTAITVGDQAATEVTVASSGAAAYGSVPAGSAGPADVVVTVPGQPAKTYPNAVTYTTDLPSTARAAISSLAVHLAEIRDRAQASQTAGTLTSALKQELRAESDHAMMVMANAIEERSEASGQSVAHPDVGAALSGAGPLIEALLNALEEAIT
jgi:hypothetical protein